MKVNNTKSKIDASIRRKFKIPFEIPNHVVELAMIIHFNHGIRRHTALNIMNYFIQQGIINPDVDKDRYIDFTDWNKFGLVVNGLKREYSYREQFFINALVGAFKAFAEDSQKTIETFIAEENKIIEGLANKNKDNDDEINGNAKDNIKEEKEIDGNAM